MVVFDMKMNDNEDGENDVISEKGKVMLVSDCCLSHMNGVLRKQNELKMSFDRLLGVKCLNVTSSDFDWGISAPYWREVRLVLPMPGNYFKLSRMIENFDPDHLIFMTEGPLGVMGAIHCKIVGRQYTTMCCTRFDLYTAQKFGMIVGWLCKKWLQVYHSFSSLCITPSPSMAEVLRRDFKFSNVVSVLNGCNTKCFSSRGTLMPEMSSMKRPIWLYVGRISVEKNVEKLLELTTSENLPGTVVLVGDGPAIDDLHCRYATNNKTPVYFLGHRSGTALEEAYRTGDIFVFPSLTDTFGQVMVEAMASGLPVAGFKDAIGVSDIVIDGQTGSLREDLLSACMDCLDNIDNYSRNSIERAQQFSWDKAAKEIMHFRQLARKRKITEYKTAQIIKALHSTSIVVFAFGLIYFFIFAAYNIFYMLGL